MRRLFHLLCLILIFALSGPIRAQTPVVHEHGAISSREGVSLTPRGIKAPEAPRIEIIAPELNATVISPAIVRLKFRPSSPAVVKLDTFKAFYGTFKIDITSRLLKVAQITSEGLTLEGAQLPSGNHKILLEIEDSEGRIGTQILSLNVQ